MTWQTEHGPRQAGVGALIEQDIHLVVTCHHCHRDVRYTPKEASLLLGSDCSLIEARDRLRCSWCGSRGRQYIDARPCTLDRSVASVLWNAERQCRLWPDEPKSKAALVEAKAAWAARRPYDTDDFICDAYRLQTPIAQIEHDLCALGLPLCFAGGAIPNDWPQLSMTAPREELPVFRPVDATSPTDGLSVAQLRWWLVPFFHRGPAAAWKAVGVNAPAEVAATSRTFKGAFERRRCLAPADAFYLWVGASDARRRWRVEAVEGGWWSLAGIWDRAQTAEGVLESFAILTTSAGEDCRPYGDRQPVILRGAQALAWLDLAVDPTPLFRPSPPGILIAVPD